MSIFFGMGPEYNDYLKSVLATYDTYPLTEYLHVPEPIYANHLAMLLDEFKRVTGNDPKGIVMPDKVNRGLCSLNSTVSKKLGTFNGIPCIDL